MLMTHTHTQVQRSVGSEDTMEINRQTDGQTDGRYRSLELYG